MFYIKFVYNISNKLFMFYVNSVYPLFELSLVIHPLFCGNQSDNYCQRCFNVALSMLN